MKLFMYLVVVAAFLSACQRAERIIEVSQWTTYEISLEAENKYGNPYIETEVWGEFKNDQGSTLIRPAFWDGESKWKIRFAPPDTGSVWTWTTFASNEDNGLAGKTGSVKSISYQGNNKLLKHGLLKMSPGKRNVVHADGTPFFVVGDTPWGIPFRAKPEQVKIFAQDRQAKGFNTVLLMSVQPDRYAEGPESRDTVTGFARGFADLRDGHINQLKPEYFQYLDSLIGILLDHEIVPVYQPVFQGFGWKGKTVLGTTVDPGEYSRYCKYLVARYGSMPAFWLISGDGTGLDKAINPAGETVEKWDAYAQPAGIHYNPADDFMPEWANGDSTRAFHYNRSYQDATWLDFQWAQTGHDGKHLTHKVERMYENLPVKAALNGEPTYEGMGGGKHGLGWWQGEEAWQQLMAGGTMGVVYGAAALWQWKITPDEEGWGEWTDQPMSWKEAMELEGSRYAGLVGKAFYGFDFADMEKRSDLANGKPLLAVEKRFYVSYLPQGGSITIEGIPADLPAYWFNPKNGKEQIIPRDGNKFIAPDQNPWVFLAGKKNQ